MNKARAHIALLAASALLLLPLAGCSPTLQLEPEETVLPSETDPADPSNTVERWAGLVAQQVREFDDWRDDWDDEPCFAISTDIRCELMLASVSFMVQTSHITIAGPSDPSALTYIGEPPAAIRPLYAETIALTERARDAGKAYLDCDGDCTAQAIELERAVDALESKFAAWSPYL